MTHPAPFDEDEDAFLAGDGEPDVDDVFAKDFDRVWEEMVRFAPDDVVWTPGSLEVPSLLVPGVVFRDVPCGILAVGPDGEPIGGYLSCDLSVDPAWQGQGLGTEIVIERCLRDGMNPVLNLDSAAYSRAGIAAHGAAWRHARENPAETALRASRILAAQAPHGEPTMTKPRACNAFVTPHHTVLIGNVIRDAVADPSSCSVSRIGAERFDDAPWYDRVCLSSPSGVVGLPVIGTWPMAGAGTDEVGHLAVVLSGLALTMNTVSFTWSQSPELEASCRRVAEAVTLDALTHRSSELADAVDPSGNHGGDLVCEIGMTDDGLPLVRVDTPSEMSMITIPADLSARIAEQEPLFIQDHENTTVSAEGFGVVHVAFMPVLNDESGQVVTIPRFDAMDILRTLSKDPS